MPDTVIDRSKIHKDETRLTSSFIALFNIASQFAYLLGSRATPSNSKVRLVTAFKNTYLQSKSAFF